MSDSSRTSAPALRVTSLSFRHEVGEARQVNNVSFTLDAGRTFGVLGGNECGKTTLAQVILGNLAPETGKVEIFGEDLTPRKPAEPRWRRVVRYALFACVAIPLLLAAVRPMWLVVALLNGAWSVPLLLFLLEGLARAHARFFAGGDGTNPTAPTAPGGLESGLAPAAMRARGVAYISSEHDAGQRLPADQTIEEAIAQHMPLPKGDAEARRREVCAALNASGFRLMKESGTPVGTPIEYLRDGLKCGELSGGQKHLIYLLSVLASRPRLLICDDCLCGLDIDRQSSFLQVLQRLQLTFGMAILYLTVDLTPFTLMAHDGAFMKHGKVLETAPAQDLVETPQRRDTQQYVKLALENEERSHGKNLRMAYQKGESVFAL